MGDTSHNGKILGRKKREQAPSRPLIIFIFKNRFFLNWLQPLKITQNKEDFIKKKIYKNLGKPFSYPQDPAQLVRRTFPLIFKNCFIAPILGFYLVLFWSKKNINKENGVWTMMWECLMLLFITIFLVVLFCLKRMLC